MNTKIEKVNINDEEAYCLGKGSALVVIHGGPGLEHSYLVNPLRSLSEQRKLYFYDQHGCGSNRTLPENFKITDLVSQFVAIIRSIGSDKPVDILAHSWGAYIFFETLKAYPDMQFGKIILVSPIGLIRSRFDDSGERLISRIPEDVMGQVEKIMEEGDGPKLMDIIAPYYMSRMRSDVRLEFKDYCAENFDRIVELLGDYDCRDIKSLLPKDIILIYGDNDIEESKDTTEIHDNVSVRIIDDAGHFSFAEQQDQFMAIIKAFLSN